MTDQPQPSDDPPDAKPPSDTPPGFEPPQYGPPPYGGQPPPFNSPYGEAPGYNAQWGYGPPGVPYGPRGDVRSDDTTWAIFAYVGMLVIGFLAPLIIYFVKKKESAFIRFHAAQALNFQITLLIHLLATAAVCVPLYLVTKSGFSFIPFIFVYLELLIGQWVFLIMGAIKAGKGNYWRFPTFFCFRMIR